MFDFKPEMNWIDSNIDYFAEKSQIHFFMFFFWAKKSYILFLGSGDSTWPIKNLCDKFTRYTFFRLFNNALTGWLVFANGNEITYTNRKKIQWELAMTMCMDWLEIHRKNAAWNEWTIHEFIGLSPSNAIYIPLCRLYRYLLWTKLLAWTYNSQTRLEMCWSRLKSAWIFPNWAHST